MLVGGGNSYKSAKQTIIDASTIEAKFVAYFEAIVNVLWLWKFISQLGVVDTIAKMLIIYCDNSIFLLFPKMRNIIMVQNIWKSNILPLKSKFGNNGCL